MRSAPWRAASRSGFPKRGPRRLVPKRCRFSGCRRPPTTAAARRARALVQPLRPPRPHLDRDHPPQAKRRAAPTTGNTTWDWFARTAPQARRLDSLPRGHGCLPMVSLRRILGSTPAWSGCARCACGTCAPASVGPTGSVPLREPGLDRQMQALDEFDITMTLCFTPEHLGVAPHYTSPPKNPPGLRRICRRGVAALRYAPRGSAPRPA